MYVEKYETISELTIRFILLIYYVITSSMKPRIREIHDEEWWLYMNPTGTNYIPFRLLIIGVMINMAVFPLVAVLINKKRKSVIINALLGYSLAISINLAMTNTIKLLVGRPRPDFYFRCFVDGKKFASCNGDDDDINEGLKSFPSGHSSMSMAAFGFTSLFLAGQLRLFAKQKVFMEMNGTSSMRWWPLENGRLLGCKLVVCLAPLFMGLIVCISRLLDFHHHFDDIAFGATLGLALAFISYWLYFPSIFSNKSNFPRFDYEIVKNGRGNLKTEGDFTV